MKMHNIKYNISRKVCKNFFLGRAPFSPMSTSKIENFAKNNEIRSINSINK